MSAPSLSRPAVCIVTLIGAGCAADDVGTTEATRVEVGVGFDRFASVDDGDTIELVFGPQGGWHVDLAARVHGVEEVEDDIILSFRVYGADEQLAYPIKRLVDPERGSISEEGALEYAGAQLVFAISDPSEVVGEGCRPEVELIIGPDVFVDDRELRVVDELP